MKMSENCSDLDPKSIAEEILGKVNWASETKGFCTCPGQASHTTADSDEDCMVYLDAVATISCFHQSCSDAVQEANRQLRKALREGDGTVAVSKREQNRFREEEKRLVRREQRARSSLRAILAKYSWTFEEIHSDSPDKPQTEYQDQWRDVVQLFDPEEVIWIGSMYDSGEGKHKQNFRRASEWLEAERPPGQLTCPATFKPGSFSRSNQNVETRRFLVVESDVLSKNQVGAVFKWLRDCVGLHLRAVVDTAGKSLHGWFDFPSKAVLEELKIVLPQLGCDPGLFRESQPCRIPGAQRDGRYQSLLYLDKCRKSAKLKKPLMALPLPELYFASHSQYYWRRTSDGNWQKINEKIMDTELKAQGFSFEEEPGELLCEAHRAKREIQLNNNISYEGRLAGHPVGPVKQFGRTVLVTEGPNLVRPEAGSHPLITHLIEGLLKTDEVDQTPYLYGWLQRAYISLASGDFTPGQALAIAGPRASGKSLLQDLITEILGGRAAKPYQYMSGGTSFNSGMFAAEHLMVEDEAASTRIADRRNLGALIKTITVNKSQTCYTKHAEEITLKPFWRLSLSMNEEAEDLMVLPPFCDGIEDKIFLLRASRVKMPMPTNSPQEQNAFRIALISEIPAFLDFLLKWEIPESLKDSRFGIATFHHPDLIEKITELQPEHRLLALVDNCRGLFVECGEKWEGTAFALQKQLTAKDASVSQQASDLLRFQNTCGTLLARLASSRPKRVSKLRESNGYSVWRITSGFGEN